MEPLVSISCLSYNHAEYIRDALDGFIIQNTSFPFEICIHDDASTDGTQDIIREYERNYPEVFKVIYQKENQYNKTRSFNDIVSKFQAPRLKGKYIADCEGDDYWFNPNKLQTQVEYMEAHEDCSASFHSVAWVKGNRVVEVVQPWNFETDVREDILIPFGATVVGTCSVISRKCAVKYTPRFLKIADVGDYPGALHLATYGHFHYFPEVMAAYRWGRAGSWTDKFHNDKEFAIKHSLNALKWLYEYNVYTKGKFVTHVGKKMREYIEGIEKAGGIAANPWLGVLMLNAAAKAKQMREAEKIKAQTNTDGAKTKFQDEENKYYSWFVERIGEKMR